MVEVRYVRNVFAGRYNPESGIISLNVRLRRPEFKWLHDTVLEHELGHVFCEGNWFKDFLFDFKEDFKIHLSPKPIHETIKFSGSDMSYRYLNVFYPLVLFYQLFILIGYLVKERIE